MSVLPVDLYNACPGRTLENPLMWVVEQLPEYSGAQAFVQAGDALLPQQHPRQLHGGGRFGLHGARHHRLRHQLPLSL